MSWIFGVPNAVKWKRIAQEAMFMGKPISKMTRDELLAIIGYLAIQNNKLLEKQFTENYERLRLSGEYDHEDV